jgi:23S rRNA (guanosine2251-2'-O)-methyltransferase
MKVKIVLDNIRSSWNVGAIMRTCDALGFELILIGYTPLPIGKTLIMLKKTAIGAENTVKWEHFDHFQEVVSKYNLETDYHFGIEIDDNSQDMLEYLFHQKQLANLSCDSNLFLWFGNEIHGLDKNLMSQMHANLHLPMNGSKESLNISNCVCAVGYLFLATKF